MERIAGNLQTQKSTRFQMTELKKGIFFGVLIGILISICCVLGYNFGKEKALQELQKTK
ncbi:MAG: hypothetical protein H7Y04_08930 [Verrucomicrobia bacterium]|nr:hypothetical protein [Cytophagales bacterium]